MENLMLVNFVESFSTFGGLAALTVVLCQFIVKMFKIEVDWLKQVISWVIPIVLCIIGYLFKIGMFSDYHVLIDWQGWLYTILVGLGIGLTSNGIYDIPLISNFLEIIGKLFKKKETV